MPEKNAEAEFSDLIGYLYDAASNLASWPAFLRKGSAYFGAFGAHLIHLDKNHPELSTSYVVGFEQYPPEIQRAAMRKQMELEKEDPRFLYARTFPNKPFCCTDVMPVEAFRATRIYRDLLQPNGIEYSLMVHYADSATDFTGLAFFRDAKAGSYCEHDCQQLGELIPHLRRTLSIQRRLFQLDRRLTASYQILENLPSGLVIVDEHGHTEFVNAVARRIIAERDGLSIYNGALQVNSMNQGAFNETVRQTIKGGQHGAIALPRPSGKAALECVVSRLDIDGRDAPENLIARSRAVVHLVDPSQQLETSEQLLQRIFGLTQAEARVLERLVCGRTPEQTADDNGVEIATVRSQLKSIFGKTNTSRQPELIQRVLSSPIWMARKI